MLYRGGGVGGDGGRGAGCWVWGHKGVKTGYLPRPYLYFFGIGETPSSVCLILIDVFNGIGDPLVVDC